MVRATRRRAGLTGWMTLVTLAGFVSGCKGGSSGPSNTVATVEVTPNSATKQVGETVQLSATVKDAGGNILSGQTVSWSSSNTSVASVSASGFVTANTIGVASVSAAAGGRSGGAVITVAGTPVASVSVAPANDTILAGETLQLTATLRDASNQVLTGREVTWASAQSAVATVSASGRVTGVTDGVVPITASSEGQSGQASITVFGPCETSLAPMIAIGGLVQGTLSTSDCRLDDDSYADAFAIQVAVDTDVQIDMTSTAFDTWLWLLKLLPTEDLEVSTFNDDIVDGNTDSQILFTLVGGEQYYILANSFDPNQFGAYELSLIEAVPDAGRRVAGVMKPGKAPLVKSLRVTRDR